jgi:hypothetical protein
MKSSEDGASGQGKASCGAPLFRHAALVTNRPTDDKALLR